ncbi:AAC(3) family N-acetyltransferase [Cellulosilyticum sp. ST5]|uniref:AAC(3) family N-acetyltransferase n=1 Tax=unclassified Cellulosilyticum TaxID=2643091 RepID=UPI000F8CBC74|nr:AAC(3) family N-acetyltransferase [Cellulosilyticum sp. WCF-2]QEH68535.1 AAC(3) family N-acetyltransferase [Cellulosilyticum sp. WCF-2]
MAYTKQDLLQALEKLKINPRGTLLVHSSMKSIGEVEGGADTVLDALMIYMKEGLLVLPTHTWSYINAENPKFDVVHSEVCVGILPELFRKRPGVVRSLHPTHSVAAIGQDKEDFIKDNELWHTPCARQSPWGKLLDRNAQIMLLGVDLRRNTFIHGVEEWVDIKGRLTDEMEPLVVINEKGEELSVPSRRHCGDHWSEYFWKVDDYFKEKGVMHLGKFGDATVRICETQGVAALLNDMLAINPHLFSNNEPLEIERYRK